MKQVLVIIKLGGSVITNKAETKPSPRISVINSLVQQIAKLYKSSQHAIILVHGAGSFGHPLAKKYELHKGMKTTEQKVGFGLTTQSMLALNALLMESILRRGVPAVSIPPHTLAMQSEGKLKNFNWQIIGEYLVSNQVPVLFGDGVLDDKWGCSILSGDTIASYLAQRLKAKKVIFLSDVDGIFDIDPKKNRSAKLISEITNRNLREVLKGIEQNNPHDVSGEMRGKILAIKKHLTGVEVNIANGLKSGILTGIMQNKKVGTRLLFA